MTPTPPASTPPVDPGTPRRRIDRVLAAVERVGNRLPDPAVLFVLLLFAVWVLSALLSSLEFSAIDPRTKAPLRIENQLTGTALAAFLAGMVGTFTGFHPLGVVLVAMLGVGVAEQTGFIHAALKALVARTAKRLLTPAIILVGIVSHTAADAGYVLVIPLGGLIFHAAGRHPIAGIGAAFAGVSGGFCASFIPTAVDPLLAGLTQAAAQIVDPAVTVNPLANWFFTSASSVLIVGLGWLITDRLVEPRLAQVPLDGEDAGQSSLGRLEAHERRGLVWATGAFALFALLLAAAAAPSDSPLRSADGSLTGSTAALMQGIVPLIFLFFLIPGVVFGYAAGTVKSHREIIQGMAKVMGTMGYYIVLAFCASLFIAAFGKSNLGALIALEGAAGLAALGLPPQVTIAGIVVLTGFVNLFVGSASAKWALLAPILVPMLMHLGISPDLSQAAYRIGDSTTNIITPLMPYFPLVVVYASRWVKGTGVGTLVSLMLPYSLIFMAGWTVLLLVYWGMGLPLGLQAGYSYPVAP